MQSRKNIHFPFLTHDIEVSSYTKMRLKRNKVKKNVKTKLEIGMKCKPLPKPKQKILRRFSY